MNLWTGAWHLLINVYNVKAIENWFLLTELLNYPNQLCCKYFKNRIRKIGNFLSSRVLTQKFTVMPKIMNDILYLTDIHHLCKYHTSIACAYDAILVIKRRRKCRHRTLREEALIPATAVGVLKLTDSKNYLLVVNANSV